MPEKSNLAIVIDRRMDPFADQYDVSRFISALDINRSSKEKFALTLPFSTSDTTAGAENEFQAVVMGHKDHADLPSVIENSNYFKNIRKRMATGETPRKLVSALEDFLNDNPENVWENSWVKFPRNVLSRFADSTFEKDMLADKKNVNGAQRNDIRKFIFSCHDEPYLRIPVSYLLKLSLADALGEIGQCHPDIRQTGDKLLGHFLNDNTSPETYSFYPVKFSKYSNMGGKIARETAKRFLFIQLLVSYANRKFGLLESGQKAMVYFAPHPAVRQKRLNDLISDSFYRELFMSPCLSGWDNGEEKYRYMNLCHTVLSRSQMNAVGKLKEAGIITRNLVTLPNISNISLANNGTHISLGSRKLSKALSDPASGFTVADEKYVGDLAIKIVEHFLPLFIGAYSADPYRLDFSDFHPEKALGFLPHELDFTHLRMIWRRWKKKAKLKIFGHPITPFGPKIIDKWLAQIFFLKGDFVQDFRLIDYFVSILSTDESPALNGYLGNDIRLKRDLADLGEFDAAMPLYLLYRLREYSVMGFSGFEGRYYSVFENIEDDMGHAASLQNLITALAYQYILSGEITHADIPDVPSIESERRQIFFGTAIGIPTFFVRKSTSNAFMRKILPCIDRTRNSHRYAGYLRIYNIEYRRALIDIIEADGKELIESMGLGGMIDDLRKRIEHPETHSASGKLLTSILEETGVKSPMKLTAEEFNLAAEKFYRETLRKRHIEASLQLLKNDMVNVDIRARNGDELVKTVLKDVVGDRDVMTYFERYHKDILEDNLDAETLRRWIYLFMLTTYIDIKSESEYLP